MHVRRSMSQSNWKAKQIQPKNRGGQGAGTSRNVKASRVLGSRLNRSIYTSAHGWKHRKYSMLCAKVDKANR